MRAARILAAAVMLAALTAGAARADWEQGPPLETPAAALAAATWDGKVYVSGGAGLLAPQDEFSVFDPAAGAWEALIPLPQGLERHAMAALDGRIYVAGGFVSGVQEPTSRMWVYDIAAEAWSEAPAMPTGRANFSLVALDGRLYAAGDGRLIAFDPAAAVWMDLGPDPAAGRRGAAAAAFGGMLWVVGGARGPADAPDDAADGGAEHEGAGPAGREDFLRRVDIYDPESGMWRRGPDLPAPARVGHAAAVSAGGLHVLGGRTPAGAAGEPGAAANGAGAGMTMTAHLALSAPTAAGQWRVAAPLPAPRAGAAAAALPDGRLVVVGGGVGGGFFAPFTALDSVDFFTE